eukprot:364221-Chlamydomonas_euryale.AAC.8
MPDWLGLDPSDPAFRSNRLPQMHAASVANASMLARERVPPHSVAEVLHTPYPIPILSSIYGPMPSRFGLSSVCTPYVYVYRRIS